MSLQVETRADMSPSKSHGFKGVLTRLSSQSEVPLFRGLRVDAGDTNRSTVCYQHRGTDGIFFPSPEAAGLGSPCAQTRFLESPSTIAPRGDYVLSESRNGCSPYITHPSRFTSHGISSSAHPLSRRTRGPAAVSSVGSQSGITRLLLSQSFFFFLLLLFF